MPSKKPDREQVNALFDAVRKGRLGKVRALLRAGVSPNARDPSHYNETPLMAAGRTGHEEVFRELVKAGADLHAVNDHDFSVLMEVADREGALPMVRAVLADGVRPSDRLPDALRYACADGELEVVRALIEAGADVNARSKEGETPLLVAVEGNRPKVVAELLRAGGRPDVRVPRDEWGDNKHYKKTALEVALAEGYTQVADVLRAAGARVPPKPKRPTKVGTVTESWKRIDAWLRANAPGWRPLRKGADGEQVKAAEKKLGFALPADLRASYRAHNGSGGESLFPRPDDVSYSLMPLSEVVRDWRMLKGLLEGGEFAGRRARGDRGVRGEWWDLGWIPFAANGAGDYLCVDLAPAAGGKRGQVITKSHESGERKLLAPSFRQWLHSLANDLEDGKVQYDEDGGLV